MLNIMIFPYPNLANELKRIVLDLLPNPLTLESTPNLAIGITYMAQNAFVQKWFNFYLFTSYWPGQNAVESQYLLIPPHPPPCPLQITFCLHFSNQKRECDNSGRGRGRLSDCLFVQFRIAPFGFGLRERGESLPALWPQSKWIPAWSDNGFKQICKVNSGSDFSSIKFPLFTLK